MAKVILLMSARKPLPRPNKWCFPPKMLNHAIAGQYWRDTQMNFGPYCIKHLNRGPKTMDVGGRMAPLVFQALRHLGLSGATPEVIDRLRLTQRIG
jgi:hypothetical protein